MILKLKDVMSEGSDFLPSTTGRRSLTAAGSVVRSGPVLSFALKF